MIRPTLQAFLCKWRTSISASIMGDLSTSCTDTLARTRPQTHASSCRPTGRLVADEKLWRCAAVYMLTRHTVSRRTNVRSTTVHVSWDPALSPFAHATTSVLPTGKTTKRSSSISSFFRATARSIGGLLSCSSARPTLQDAAGNSHASSDISHVPQCTPTLFFTFICMAMRTAPSGSVCCRCMCQRGSYEPIGMAARSTGPNTRPMAWYRVGE